MAQDLRDLLEEQNPVVKILGWSDDVGECMHCGRIDLKGTLICEHAHGDISYMGSVCGANAYRWGHALERREEAKFARQLEKMAKEADHQRAKAAWRAFIDHPLYLRSAQVYRQLSALNLPPGLAYRNHPMAQEHRALREQAKVEIMAQFGVKSVPCIV